MMKQWMRWAHVLDCRPHWRRSCLVAAVLLLGSMTVSLVVLIYLWKTPPAHWWQRQQWRQRTTVEERKTLAIELEKRILNQLFANHRTGSIIAGHHPSRPPARLPDTASAAPEEPVEEITLGADEINAWLETRLPELLANQNISMPQGLSDPMVAVESDRLVLAFRYDSPKLSQIFTLRLRPQIIPSPLSQAAADQAGPLLRLHLDRLEGGRLPLPAALVQQAMDRIDSPRAMQAALAILDGQTVEPVAPMPGDRHRQLRLLDCSIHPQIIRLKLRIETRAAGRH